MSTRSAIDDAVKDVISGQAMEDAQKREAKRQSVAAPAQPDDDVASKISSPTDLVPGPSIGSSCPPSIPSLRRNQAGLQARPGAMAIPGTMEYHSPAADIDDGHVVDEQSQEDRERRTNSNSSEGNRMQPDVLVNAHLVPWERDIEQGSTAPAAQVTSVADNSSTLVKAEPLNEADSGLRDLLKSRTVQLVLLVVCLLIVGLIIGVVVGFASNNSGGDATNDDYSDYSDNNDNNDTNDGDDRD
jgi:hypothetical protein